MSHDSQTHSLHGIRVLIAEDEALIAEELRERLSRRGLKVEGAVRTGPAALDHVRRNPPDIVLMDVRLAGPCDGIEAAGQIRQYADVPIVYLTAHSDAPTLERAKKTAPDGYVLKPFDERDVLVAIEMALARRAMNEDVTSGVLVETPGGDDEALADASARYEQLTSRQRQVFALVALGRLNKQIAAELGMTERTVKAHRAALMRRMQIGSVADLARIAERLGM